MRWLVLTAAVIGLAACPGPGSMMPDGSVTPDAGCGACSKPHAAAEFASGSTLGAHVQTSEHYTNLGVLGESTPPSAELSSASWRHRGGLSAAIQ